MTSQITRIHHASFANTTTTITSSSPAANQSVTFAYKTQYDDGHSSYDHTAQLLLSSERLTVQQLHSLQQRLITLTNYVK